MNFLVSPTKIHIRKEYDYIAAEQTAKAWVDEEEYDKTVTANNQMSKTKA